jgi:hypothetical protein
MRIKFNKLTRQWEIWKGLTKVQAFDTRKECLDLIAIFNGIS